MSMARLGAKYAEVGCKVYGYFWVHVYAFWVHVYGSVGCMYAMCCKLQAGNAEMILSAVG